MPHELSGLDAAFLYLETPSEPLHVGQVSLFDPSTSVEPYSFGRVRSLLSARAARIAPFRRRLVPLPFGVGPPLWVDGGAPDLDHHFQEASLPQPGDTAALAGLAEDFLQAPLDRAHPLWEMQVVEGVEDGMVAALAKVHHAAVDGISGAEMTANLLDLEPDPAPEPEADPPVPESLPSRWDLARRAAIALAGQPRRSLAAVTAAAGAVTRVRHMNRTTDEVPPPSPFHTATLEAPLVGCRRRVGFARLDLEGVDTVRKAVGATHNDVVLATCAGALRAYLAEISRTPDHDLTAAVPISVRGDDQHGSLGTNRLSGMLVDLATSVTDPRERLARIARCSARAKRQHTAMGNDTVARLTDAIPPLLGAQAPRFEGVMRRMHRAPVDMIVSTFPGPPFPLYCAGARLVASCPFGPLAGGIPLNITAQTYLDAMHVGVLSDPDAVPDGEILPSLLEGALGELVKAVA